MNSLSKNLLVCLAFLALAALLRFWIGPLAERLPENYFSEAKLTEENKFRDSATGDWQVSTLNAVRIDQTITNSGELAIVEGALHVYFTTGAVNFEVTSLYGVDRRTRLNLAGYGAVDRRGQYLFPPHVQPADFLLWDPMFVGQRQGSFERVENIEGLQVYVFKFSGSGMEETAGYSYLPDVPENYLVHTDGQGTLWVEPLSGILVAYEDSGVSYFIDPASGERIADFNQWTEKFTEETRSAQLTLARSTRLRILVLEAWFPAALLLAGLLFPGVFLVRKVKKVEKGKLP
jgi:hypothetical protein